MGRGALTFNFVKLMGCLPFSTTCIGCERCRREKTCASRVIRVGVNFSSKSNSCSTVRIVCQVTENSERFVYYYSMGNNFSSCLGVCRLCSYIFCYG